MNFIEKIFNRLSEASDRTILQEVRDDALHAIHGDMFASVIKRTRANLRKAGLKKGDRCALLAHNSMWWAAVDRR
jgi:long-subunit acyl-CoA synthetase (AMP-forming)